MTEVDPAELDRRARMVCDIADDLRVAASAWRTGLASPKDGCELSTVADAIGDVREVWGRDFSVYQEVLRKWCEAGQAAAHGYRTVDEYAAARNRRVL